MPIDRCDSNQPNPTPPPPKELFFMKSDLLYKLTTILCVFCAATEQKCDDVNGNDMVNLDWNSAESEVFQAARIEESASVEQRSIG